MSTCTQIYFIFFAHSQLYKNIINIVGTVLIVGTVQIVGTILTGIMAFDAMYVRNSVKFDEGISRLQVNKNVLIIDMVIRQQ